MTKMTSKVTWVSGLRFRVWEKPLSLHQRILRVESTFFGSEIFEIGGLKELETT